MAKKEIDIAQAPLTTKDIVAKKRAFLKAIGVLECVTLSYVMVVVCLSKYGEVTEAIAGLALLSLCVSVAGGLCLGVFLEKWAAVGKGNCEELLELCQKTPEGQAYRAAVIEQGREFVNGELVAMQRWVQEAKKRNACKALYGISS